MFGMTIRYVAKKLKPKMKSIELKTPPEQTQTITRVIFDIVKGHGPLTIADTWDHVKGCLLLANALAILNEDDFLAPRGWSFSEFSEGKTKSFKGQLIGLIYATLYIRVPLILLNFIFIVVKLVSG